MNLDMIYAAVAGSVLPTAGLLWVKYHVAELRVQVDGRLTQLLAASTAQATAEATLIEKETHNGDVLHEIAGAQKAALELAPRVALKPKRKAKRKH